MGLDSLLSQMEGQGYIIEPPVIIPACAVNAPHRRDRVFIVAHATESGLEGAARPSVQGTVNGFASNSGVTPDTLHSESARIGCVCRGGLSEQESERPSTSISGYEGNKSQYGLRLSHDGIPEGLAGYPDWAGGDWEAPAPLAQSSKGRVNKLKALGNAVVPFQVLPILQAIADMETESC
jgi:DNA (cytosine-5)-methyltransferase 1